MSEQNFERIAQLIAQLDSKMEAKFEQIDAKFEQMDAKFETFKSEIISEFNHSLDIKFERRSQDVKLLGDGLAYVTERVDEVHRLAKEIKANVDRLSVEFAAHRLDPEAHIRPGGYRVKEDETGFGEILPADNEQTGGAELLRRLEESRRKYDAVTEEINAYCAEKGVELPKLDGEEVIRQIRLESARYRVEQELKKRREEEQKP